MTLSVGGNTITVVATDNASLTTTDTRTIYYDSTAPVILIDQPADNSNTKIGTVTVSGSVDADSKVIAVTNNTNPVIFTFNAVNGTFSADVALGIGLNTIVVNASDLANNTASATRTVRYDNVNPSVAVTNPGQDTETNQSMGTISGTVGDDVTVSNVTMTVNGTPTPVTVGVGTFTANVNFATEGTYAIVVTATDEAGNMASAMRNIIYDKTGPVTVATPAGGTYDTTQSVTLSCNDASGSGCASTMYCLGNGCTPNADYTVPIIISSSTDLRFFSIDNAGNSENVKTDTYNVNSSVPIVNGSLGPCTMLATSYVDSSTSGSTVIVSWGDSQSTTLPAGSTFNHTYATARTYYVGRKAVS